MTAHGSHKLANAPSDLQKLYNALPTPAPRQPRPPTETTPEARSVDFGVISDLTANSRSRNCQVQNRFHWDKALGGRLFCHSGKTVTPYSLLLLKDPAGGFPLTVGSCPTLPYHPSLCGRLNKSGSMMLRAINFFALLCS